MTVALLTCVEMYVFSKCMVSNLKNSIILGVGQIGKVVCKCMSWRQKGDRIIKFNGSGQFSVTNIRNYHDIESTHRLTFG